jgi:hypothetical protein
MNTRVFALVYGIVFLAVGIAGFIPGITQPGGPSPEGSPPVHDVHLLLGIFPVNAAHNLVHVLFGLGGLIASRDLRLSWFYACITGAVYLILFFMGLTSGLKTMFGMAPLYGADVWLHLVLAVIAIAFAVTGRGKQRQPLPPDATR